MQLPARLTDPWFEAHFYGYVTSTGWRVHHEDGSPILFSEAQGLALWCPCGYGMLDENGNERFPLDLSLNRGRPHLVLIPFANPPSGVPLPPEHGPFSRDGLSHPRWTLNGTDLDNLSLQPSVDVGNTTCWHGFITNGEVR